MLILWLICLLPTVTAYADDAPDSSIIVYTYRDTDLYQHPDKTHRLGSIPAGTEFKLLGIKGSNEWILVANDSTRGWINRYSVKYERTFIAGYLLRLHQWSMEPSDFEHKTGVFVEWRDRTEENHRQGYLFPGLYPKRIFATRDEAKHLGDSLAKLGILHDEIGMYYRIIPLFKPQHPHLYFVNGFGKPIACPVCGGMLYYPPLIEMRMDYYREYGHNNDMIWVNRVSADEFWIRQCKNGHLVITYHPTWD
jgi:hypothetical protein